MVLLNVLIFGIFPHISVWDFSSLDCLIVGGWNNREGWKNPKVLICGGEGWKMLLKRLEF